MDTKQFFKDVYDDFFGVEKIKAENEKLIRIKPRLSYN